MQLTTDVGDALVVFRGRLREGGVLLSAYWGGAGPGFWGSFNVVSGGGATIRARGAAVHRGVGAEAAWEGVDDVRVLIHPDDPSTLLQREEIAEAVRSALNALDLGQTPEAVIARRAARLERLFSLHRQQVAAKAESQERDRQIDELV